MIYVLHKLMLKLLESREYDRNFYVNDILCKQSDFVFLNRVRMENSHDI